MYDKIADWATDHYALVLIIIGVALVVVLMARPINKATNIRTIEGTVTDKVVKSDKYMVFIQDDSGETVPLEITDSLFKMRFNSSDLWGDIEKGKTYIFEVGGSRWDVRSWYPNIYKAKEKIE